MDAAVSAAMKAHITATLLEFKDRIPDWDVANEVFESDGSMRNSFSTKNLGPPSFKTPSASPPTSRRKPGSSTTTTASRGSTPSPMRWLKWPRTLHRQRDSPTASACRCISRMATRRAGGSADQHAALCRLGTRGAHQRNGRANPPSPGPSRPSVSWPKR